MGMKQTTASHGATTGGLTGSSGTTAGHGTTTGGLTGSSGTTGGYTSSTTAGPHSSNLLNKLDPRVDSDLGEP